MTSKNRNKLMTTAGVATMLNVHINTVRRWSNTGILKAYRIGPRGDRRFIRDEIISILALPQYGHKTWKISEDIKPAINVGQEKELEIART